MVTEWGGEGMEHPGFLEFYVFLSVCPQRQNTASDCLRLELLAVLGIKLRSSVIIAKLAEQ